MCSGAGDSKPQTIMKTRSNPLTITRASVRLTGLLLTTLLCSGTGQLLAASSIIYSNSFENYSAVATDLSDTTSANPTGSEWSIVDDTPLSPDVAGTGVQVINWLTNHTGAVANKSLLVRPGSEADVYLTNTKSGSRYQLDFWAYIARGPTSDRSFLSRSAR